LPTVDLEAFPMRFPLLLCPFFAVAVALPSQTTHLVGPGGLAQIRDALAIAQPGDRIHVQPGTYAHFTATVGVTIRALAPGSVVVRYDTAYAPPTCPFCVDEGPTRFAIPAGQTAHVVGIHFEASAPTIVFAPIFHRVEVQSGRVHFEDCILAARRFQALQIAQAAQVHLNATTVAGFGGPLSQGASGIRVLGGTLTAVGCQIGGGAGSSPVDGAGLGVSGGTVHLSDCLLIGGSGSPFSYTFPALQGVGSAWLHGCVLQGGGCAVNWGGTQPDFDDCTFTSPTNCGIPTGPFPTLLGVAQATPPLLGAPFTLDWRTEPNGLVAVFASFGLGRLDLPGILAQPGWLDPANEFFVGALFADPSGAATTMFALPANPLLTDLELWFKGVSGFSFPLQSSVPAGGVLR
jgi:hypothetical protein